MLRVLLDELSSARSLAKRSRDGGVERCGWTIEGLDAGDVTAAAVVAAWLRGVKDAASGFRAGRSLPVPDVADCIVE